MDAGCSWPLSHPVQAPSSSRLAATFRRALNARGKPLPAWSELARRETVCGAKDEHDECLRDCECACQLGGGLALFEAEVKLVGRP